MGSTKQIHKIKTVLSFLYTFIKGRHIYFKSYNDWPNVKNVLREMSITCYRNSGEKKFT